MLYPVFGPDLGLASFSLYPAMSGPFGVATVTPTVSGVSGSRREIWFGSSYWERLLIKFAFLCGWISERVRLFGRMSQEIRNETAEELRLWTCPSASAGLSASSPLKPPARGAPTTFPQFSRLPAELRQQIWTEALPGPRLLLMHLPPGATSQPRPQPFISIPRRRRHSHHRPRHGRFFQSEPEPWPRDYTLVCPTPPPALLHVNSESRAVALRHYRLGLAPVGHEEPRVYMDPARDVIGLSNATMETVAGRSLLHLTPDVLATGRLCLASAAADGFLERPVVAATLERLDEVVVVDSVLFGEGHVPGVAELDWEYWLHWQRGKGAARWVVGGDGAWRWKRRDVLPRRRVVEVDDEEE